MHLSDLKQYDLLYLGSPYSRYPGGIIKAFIDVCKLTACLIESGLKVYTPIGHTHSIAVHGNIDPLDHKIWLPFDQAIMDKSDAMIVAMMETWDQSYGVRHEINTFQDAGKLVFYLNPTTLEVGMTP